jgi:DNA processing protein
VSDFKEALGWYTLFSAKGVGPKTLHHIHRTLSKKEVTAAKLCSLNFAEFQALLPRINRKIFDAIHQCGSDSEREFQMLAEKGISVIHLGHERYPSILSGRLQTTAPPLLFGLGNLELLKAESIAIVGSRDASEKGLDLARSFAGEFACAGMNVISGYARGIDMQSHLGALQKEGTTTIVPGAGILGFKRRKEFTDLRWEDSVLVLSQFHPSERWRAGNAMVRNRLVCALASAVVVVESGQERDRRGKMSGTFNTGKAALEMGVPLFAFDPAIFEKHGLGNEHLIRLGAMVLKMDNGIRETAHHVLANCRNHERNASSQSGEVDQMTLFP